MKFIMTADYHTHTYYSDGVGSIEENVESAREKGLKTIGITDHGFFHVAHGIRRKDVEKMRAEIQKLRLKYPDMQILLGVEANLINLRGELDLREEDIALFDYIIFGVHKFACSIKRPSSIWFTIMNLFFKNCKRRIKKVTESYIRAIQNYPVKLVVHPNYAMRVDVARLAEFAKNRGVWIELNGKRINMNSAEAEALKSSGVTLVIGSDAHTPSRVGEDGVPRQFIMDNNIPLESIINIETKQEE